MNKIAAKSEQFIDFTKINSDKVLKLERNIAYFYGVEDRKLVAQHYIQAIKTLETEGVTSDKKVLRDKGISVKKLKTANDESYPALRVADAIAGAIRYRCENSNDKRIIDIYEKFSKKILITLEE